MTTCPTCGQKGGDRVRPMYDFVDAGHPYGRTAIRCDDPFHDLADRVVELRDALRKTMTRIASMPDRGSWLDAKELGEIATDIRKALSAGGR